MRYTGLGVHLKVRDIAKSRSFYEGLLGLVPMRGSGDDAFRATLPQSLPSRADDGLPGAPDHWCSITYEPSPSAELEIADGHPAVTDDAVFAGVVDGPKVSAMLHAESLVPLLRDRGVVPSYPVRRYAWGTIELVLRDPDGFLVVVIAPASDDELTAIRKFVPVEVVPN